MGAEPALGPAPVISKYLSPPAETIIGELLLKLNVVCGVALSSVPSLFIKTLPSCTPNISSSLYCTASPMFLARAPSYLPSFISSSSAASLSNCSGDTGREWQRLLLNPRTADGTSSLPDSTTVSDLTTASFAIRSPCFLFPLSPFLPGRLFSPLDDSSDDALAACLLA
uniref:Uncharacterized protein n=1 Tax=Chromera velia CCMP2878 TaxID=1169474 RepID=A0A0G4IET5_9ALVE|eukprot:Cvel_2441.t1-p1 / transcript=Cvel_2441.t1 / gene=Cvel_2441 / organism=Chromera_velia_CCMP2878 / gene_product=hypothetical protein / transcript_product=hypothetical protein / location=Cvel_scaffold95:124344-124847(-) / protein_length=168 / sequence_SO=supercontig / SO=protein_coding / is_pseudo=false